MKNTYEKLNKYLVSNIILVIIFMFLFLLLFIQTAYDKQAIPNESLDSFETSSMPVTARKMGGMRLASFAVASDSSTMNFSADNKKIVKNSSLQIEVKDVEKAKGEVEQKIEKIGGYVDNFNSYTYYNEKNIAYNFTIRVPSEKLDATIADIKQIGLLKSESLSVSDITESYRDTENQLKNLSARRDRLRKLMEMTTQNVKDILEVDRELTQVQNTIESLTILQNKRDKDVAYSVLNLTIVPEVKIDDLTGSDWKFSSSWKNAVNSLIKFTQMTVDNLNLVAVFSPIWLVALGLVWIVIRKIKKN